MAEPSYGASVAAIDSLLRSYRASNPEVPKLIGTNQELFRWIQQDTNASGSRYECPLIVRGPVGIGPTRAIAQSQGQSGSGAPKSFTWTGEWAPLKASFYLEEEAIIKGMSGEQSARAYLDVVKDQIEMELRAFGDRTEEQLWAGFGKAIGYGAFSAGVITLSDPGLASNFTPGDILQGSANDGSSGAHSTFAGLAYVVAVNANTGEISVSATDGGTVGTPTGWTGNVYLFRQGLFAAGATTGFIYGLPQYLPAADPSGSFLGVDRTSAIVQTSGVRLTSSDVGSLTALGTAKKLLKAFRTRGFDLKGQKALWVHPDVWDEMANELEISGNRSLPEKDAISGLSTIKVRSQLGDVPVMSARNCGRHQMYLLDRAALKFKSFGKWPRELTKPTSKSIESPNLMATADYWEWRWLGLGQLQVMAPGSCGVSYVR